MQQSFFRLSFLLTGIILLCAVVIPDSMALAQTSGEETASENTVDTVQNDSITQLLVNDRTESTFYKRLKGVFNGLLGLAVLLFIAFLFSTQKRRINWKLVIIGLILQAGFALLVLKVPFAKDLLNAISTFFVKILDFSKEGSTFLFGELANQYVAFQILPPIIFFSALTSLFYYLNILQRIVYGFAWVMRKSMQLSGAESLAAAANIFIGQTEAPLVVKPYIAKMTRSEMMALMTGGMATIAGGVMAAYIGFLGGEDPEARQLFARHLLTASIMSAPAALLVAKIMIPETENPDRELLISGASQGSNLLDSITYGTLQGLKLAVNVGAMILVFLALMAFLNFIFENWIGAPLGINDDIKAMTDGRFSGLSLEVILGYLFAPLAWLIGVPSGDLLMVGQLLGEKTAINEFIAYKSLASMKDSGLLQPKSLIIATYALCGFANFGAMGIQIGGISAIAPNQRLTLSQLGFYSLIGGTIACLMTGCIAGMIV